MSKELRVAAKLAPQNSGNTKQVSAPCGLQVMDGCPTSPISKDHLFSNVSNPVLQRLDAISFLASYPPGAVLFVEGQQTRGVFIICNGRVKLSAGSAKGKALIFRVAHPGEIIGVPSTLSGKPYQLTAEALEPLQANFVAREDFLSFLRQNGEAAFRVAEALSDIYRAACQEIRFLGLSRTASEKLARFLLNLTAGQTTEDGLACAKLTLTHEEIGEMIGTSRETVTRLLASFKRKGWVEVRGVSLIIKNQSALEELLQT